MNNKIINFIELNRKTEGVHLFRMNINKPEEMFNIVLEAFKNNKDDVGKEIINFKFAMKNRGFQYDFSPFDFFCFVCQNELMDILFRIIEDEYFWKKDKIIFESEIDQTPKQWLIASAGYIYCSLNKISSLKLICDKYNITTFDAVQSMFFDVAISNNFKELLQYLTERYKHYTLVKKIYKDTKDLDMIKYESSLYNMNKVTDNGLYYIIRNDEEKIYAVPEFKLNESKDNNEIIAIENPMYGIS